VCGHIYASGASIVPLPVICLLNFELFGHVVNLFVLIFQSIAYQWVSHLEQELITIKEQPFSPPGFNKVRIARSLVCYVQVARSLVCCVMFYTLLFFWPFSIYDFWLPLWCLQTFLPARWSYKYSWQNCSQLSIRRFNVIGSHKGSWRVNKKRHVRSNSICVFEINIF
jgi:hypothetical protein